MNGHDTQPISVAFSTQPRVVFGPRDDGPTIEEIHEYVSKSLKELRMLLSQWTGSEGR